MIFTVNSERDLNQVASYLIKLMDRHILFLLKGDLGSGKTTLVKKWMVALQSKDEVSSPTFSLINEYELSNDTMVYHMDLYRLNDLEELYNIGIEEYLNRQRSFCLIEWPELLLPVLKDNYVMIRITEEGESRSIDISEH